MTQAVLAFFATFCFAVMFNVPKSELLFSGLVGAWGWIIYQIPYNHNLSVVTCTFMAAIAVTLMSRVLAIVRKMPLTLFLTSGIIPLVPGAGIYGTMYFTVTNDISQATAKGIETFKIAGVISIGIMIVLALPAAIFSLGVKNFDRT